MDAATVELLDALNRRFYSRHAASFDGERRAPWPGWKRVSALVADIDHPSILDAGCGNARFGHYLEGRLGRAIDYVGVDASAELLRLAAARAPAGWRWVAADLLAGRSPGSLSDGSDLVTCFGVLHHVPGEAARRSLLESLAAEVTQGGHLAVSFWRLGTRERFRRRAVDAGEIRNQGLESLDPAQLDENDFLLPWGDDGGAEQPLRYCHHVGSAEAERLVTGLGLAPVDEYLADGRSGDLNRYRVLRRD